MMSKKFLVLATIAIVLAVLAGVYFYTSDKKPARQPVACTMEALLCPGGDYVGRSGPRCEFSPCIGDSFTGTLTQDSYGFWMLLDAPQEGTQEMVYKMPVKIKISNALRDLVGKRVQVFGAFETGNTFNVDYLVELAGDAGNANLGQVGVGESALVNGVRITLNKIASDSRCPQGAQCIQAGSVVANVTLQSDTDKTTVDISSVQAPLPFDSFKVSIANISPKRLPDIQPKPSEYKITFHVDPL